jgi:hypothetical protein
LDWGGLNNHPLVGVGDTGVDIGTNLVTEGNLKSGYLVGLVAPRAEMGCGKRVFEIEIQSFAEG